MSEQPYSSSSPSSPSSPDDPTIRVVAGSPTPEELAAVTAVLSAFEAEAAAESAARRLPVGQTGWAESQRALRTPLRTGPGQWTRHSA